MGGAAYAVQALFAGQHFHDHELIGGGLREDYRHVGDFERGQTAASSLSGGGNWAGGCGYATSREETQSVTSIHSQSVYSTIHARVRLGCGDANENESYAAQAASRRGWSGGPGLGRGEESLASHRDAARSDR